MMATPGYGPAGIFAFGQASPVNTVDPLSMALEQRYHTMSQAGRSGYEGQSDALSQALGLLQQANAGDTAPTMDQPFPTGGILGALAGAAAGMGGLLPNVMRANQMAEMQNMRQAGFLKLRQADREKQMADLQMKQAGLDADYEKAMAELRTAKDMDQANLAAKRAESIQRQRAEQQKWLTREGREAYRSLDPLLTEAATAGTYGGQPLHDDRIYELAKAKIEERLAEIPPEMRGGLLERAMKSLELGREYALSQVVPPPVDDPTDRTIGEAAKEGFMPLLEESAGETGKALGGILEWFTGEPAGLTLGRVFPSLGSTMAAVGADEPQTALGPQDWVPEVAAAIPQFGSPLAGLSNPDQMAVNIGDLLPSMAPPTPQVTQARRLADVYGPPPDQLRQEYGTDVELLNKNQQKTIREIRKLSQGELTKDQFQGAPASPFAPVGGRNFGKVERLRGELFQLRDELLRAGIDADDYLFSLLGDAYGQLTGGE